MKGKVKLVVKKISETTESGNVILTLSAKGTVKKTALGNQKSRGAGYLTAVEAESCEVAVGEEIELDLNDFDQVSRPFEGKDGNMVDIPWLVIK